MPKSKNKRKWYNIKQAPVSAAGKSQTEILIYGDIGQSWWDDESITAKQLVEDLSAIETDEVVVRINSFGGRVADGIAIFNALRRHKADIQVEIDAVAYSIASLIAMAGDETNMADNGLLMLHAPWDVSVGNAEEHRRAADILDKYAGAMTTAYLRDGGPDKAQIESWLKDGEDHYFTAAEALEIGLIDSTTASLDIAASLRTMDLGRYQKPAAMAVASITKPEHMNMPEAKTAAAKEKQPAAEPKTAPNVVDIEKAKQEGETQALAGLQARNNTLALIKRTTSNAKVQTLCDECMADASITLADAQEQISAAYKQANDKEQPESAAGAPTIPDGGDSRDKRVAGVTNILLARSHINGEDGKRIQTNDNPWRGMTLMDIARDSLAQAGVDTRGMRKREIVSAGFTQSTSDFPVLLENAMHKALLAGYNLAPDTWSIFCAVGSVSDFRAHNRYMVGSLGNLEDLTELGEFKDKPIPDGRKESVSIGTKGNLINLSRHAVINDDLGAFVGLAVAIGRAGRRTIESTVYSTMALNGGLGPVLNDSKTLFHADHGNIAGSPGAPAVATVEQCILKMAAQTDVSGNDFLDLSPTIWLGPKNLEVTARVLNASTTDPDAPAKTKNDNVPNPYQNYFSDLVATPRMTGAPWYVFSDPSVAPVIEVSFLDGEQEPFLDLEEGFSVDGARYKARLDFGVSGVGYEGAVRNDGA